ncbi:MAG: hypothetical protein A2487_15255 [Candidatus Raymondbacteria bacterium RifOxyC12_full_50_8]|nr:MAG: hypothetical protein A2487_15255 [Candidatus Raymondbacteria bacterium RifOxyC12_full_50_8]
MCEGIRSVLDNVVVVDRYMLYAIAPLTSFQVRKVWPSLCRAVNPVGVAAVKNEDKTASATKTSFTDTVTITPSF